MAIVRFLVHELITFIEISTVLIAIILVLAWFLAKRSEKPAAGKT
jgi:hypothetical protein